MWDSLKAWLHSPPWSLQSCASTGNIVGTQEEGSTVGCHAIVVILMWKT